MSTANIVNAMEILGHEFDFAGDARTLVVMTTFAVILVTQALAWIAGLFRKPPAPSPLETKVDRIEATLGELLTLVRATAVADVFYATKGGRKLHAARDCTALRGTASELVEIGAPPATLEFLRRADALCDRCAEEAAE